MITAIISNDQASNLWRKKGNEISITTPQLLSDEQCRELYALAVSMAVSGKTAAELYSVDVKAIEALRLIADIAYDYDGYESVEGLKSLIDEMREIAIENWNRRVEDADDKKDQP